MDRVKVHGVTRFFPIISRPWKEISPRRGVEAERAPPPERTNPRTTIDQYEARRHRFQRENNEICSIIGRQFIVAEWFLLRLTTAGTEGALRGTRRKTISREEMGLFFHPPFARLSLLLILVSFSTTPIVRIYFLSADLSSPFFFTSLPSRTVPSNTMPSSLLLFSSLPPRALLPLYFTVLESSPFLYSASTSLAYPAHGSFHLTCGARSAQGGRG